MQLSFGFLAPGGDCKSASSATMAPFIPLILIDPARSNPSLSSADLQFLENRKFSRSEICAAFGVLEEIVTTTDNAK